MQQRSLRSRRWLTGDDLRRLGGQVRAGEKPVTLVRYRPSLSLFKVIRGRGMQDSSAKGRFGALAAGA
ncbi:hypothetical protein DPK31_05835 [Salmonella enterica subsp. enterica serovar Umbilo]|nr:hypothetical protein [Salmonella enterica subsp. enterica serovar Umbilo]